MEQHINHIKKKGEGAYTNNLSGSKRNPSIEACTSFEKVIGSPQATVPNNNTPRDVTPTTNGRNLTSIKGVEHNEKRKNDNKIHKKTKNGTENSNTRDNKGVKGDPEPTQTTTSDSDLTLSKPSNDTARTDNPLNKCITPRKSKIKKEASKTRDPVPQASPESPTEKKSDWR